MMSIPREVHLEHLFHMFTYLRIKNNSSMVFDPTEPEIDDPQFVCEDCSDSAYSDCKEELSSNAPQPKVIVFTMRVFVYSDHSGEINTRRSRTGFIIFLKSAPIYWLSKRQTSVETRSFETKFIAMKQCCEYVRGLLYKLRMMGIPIYLQT